MFLINFVICRRTYQWKTCTRHQSTSGSETTGSLVANHWLVSTQSSLLQLSNASCRRRPLQTIRKWMVRQPQFPCSRHYFSFNHDHYFWVANSASCQVFFRWMSSEKSFPRLRRVRLGGAKGVYVCEIFSNSPQNIHLKELCHDFSINFFLYFIYDPCEP